MIPQPTQQEIEQIDRWIELVYPHKNEFQIVDIYIKTLTEELYKQMTYDYWRQQASEMRTFLEKFGVIAHHDTKDGVREYLTQLGEDIAKAGGWVKYHVQEQEKKDKAMLVADLDIKQKTKAVQITGWQKAAVIISACTLVLTSLTALRGELNRGKLEEGMKQYSDSIHTLRQDISRLQSDSSHSK